MGLSLDFVCLMKTIISIISVSINYPFTIRPVEQSSSLEAKIVHVIALVPQGETGEGGGQLCGDNHPLLIVLKVDGNSEHFA